MKERRLLRLSDSVEEATPTEIAPPQVAYYSFLHVNKTILSRI